jgi:phospholipase C
MVRKCVALSLSATMVLAGCGSAGVTYTAPVVTTPTPTPVTSSQVIKHVVVIFGENISFDHYFGTYPNVANYTTTPTLLTANPNLSSVNGAAAANPYRLAPAQAATNDQDHNYGPEQTAFDGGKMDKFPLSVGVPDSAAQVSETNATAISGTNALTMGYYDGNTVTALWNYAQHYAMNDHSFGSTFGPSTPGAINLASGQTNGASFTLP